MSRLESIVARLPSVYRPDPRRSATPATLFDAVLAAVAGSLDRAHDDIGEILLTRWADYADRAEYDRFFALSRRLDPSLDARDFPYIRDLARIAALLPLPPWEQPPEMRESTEDFRLRLKRIVRLYRDGLSTVAALRAVVEANLPVAGDAPEELRDRPFTVEIHAPSTRAMQAPTRGAPDLQLGPLMRFSVHNRGRLDVHPTLYVQGLSADHGGPSPVLNPMIERHAPTPGGTDPTLGALIGLALRGTLAAGDTLRVAPAYNAFTAAPAGLQQARSVPTEQAPANAAVDGPFADVPDAPPGAVSALLHSADGVLWVALDGGAGASSLWRFDGTAMVEAVSGLDTVNTLLDDGSEMLVGTAGGLARVALYPVPAGSFTATAVAALATTPINALARGADGRVWVGTDTALLELEASDSVTAFGPGSRADLETEVLAITEDVTGTLYVGTPLGVLAWQRANGRWSWYEGTSATEQVDDWRRFDPANPASALPAEEAPFIPAVRCALRADDGTLWLGTAAGLARYLARPPLTPSGDRVGSGLSLMTVLEAFPDLDTGPVHAIREDARGRIWFATERGLLRFDGRDMWQRQGGGWVQLGRADVLYPAGRPSLGRGTWRYDRNAARWERYDLRTGRWDEFSAPPRTTGEPPVRDIVWVPGAAADTGTFDGTTFTPTAPVAPGALVVRVKPDETRIVNGGIPAVPALPVGPSVWRYLSMEPEDYVPPALEPVWSPEGRRVGPAPAGLVGAPPPARYDIAIPPPSSDYDRSVFAYPPVAQVWLSWLERQGRSVLVRLAAPVDGAALDPAILDRVWQGIQLVRPAGVRAALAVDERIVKVQDGNA